MAINCGSEAPERRIDTTGTRYTVRWRTAILTTLHKMRGCRCWCCWGADVNLPVVRITSAGERGWALELHGDDIDRTVRTARSKAKAKQRCVMARRRHVPLCPACANKKISSSKVRLHVTIRIYLTSVPERRPRLTQVTQPYNHNIRASIARGARFWLGVKPVDSDKLPSAFCPWRTSTSSEVSEQRWSWSRPCNPAELMLCSTPYT